MEQNYTQSADSYNRWSAPYIDYRKPKNEHQFRQLIEDARRCQQEQYRDQFRDSRYENNNYRNDQYRSGNYRGNSSRSNSHRRNNNIMRSQSTSTPYSPKEDNRMEYQQPTFNWEKPDKKKINPLMIAIPVIILLIVAGALYFILNNTVSYRKAEENYFNSKKTAADKAFSEYEKYLYSPFEANVTVSAPLAKAAGLDLSNITLHLDRTSAENNVYGTCGLTFGGNKLNAEYWANKADGKIYALFPEISDIYAYFDSSIFKSEAGNTDAFKEALRKAAEVYFDFVGDPEIIKNRAFSLNDTVYHADSFDITFDSIQLAKTAKAFLESIMSNESVFALIGKTTGNEAEFTEKVNDFLNRLNGIIDGSVTDNTSFKMTVYVQNKTVIGREITVTKTPVNTDTPENTENADNENNVMSFNFYEVPTDNGHFTYLNFKSDKKSVTVSCNDTVKGESHTGTVTVICGGTYYVVYSDLAVTENLFQGIISVTSIEDPALEAVIELTKGDNVRTVDVSIPNICTANAVITPFEGTVEEMPELSEGGFADLTPGSDISAEANEKFFSDIQKYVLNGFIKNSIGDITKPSNNTKPAVTTDNSQNKAPDETSETAAVTSAPPNGETTAPENGVSEGNAASNNTTNPPAPSQNGSNTVTFPSDIGIRQPSATASVRSNLDVGNARKISSPALNSFNSGNYYTAEIYVDENGNADSGVTVSELSGTNDSYVKGKVLQIDFAEGYDFDCALVVLTLPSSTVTNGRNYPDSEILRGLNRYSVMGMDETERFESEIDFYKYSANQIGFIVDKPGYYYLMDMDDYYYSVFGVSPDEISVGYAS